MKDNRNNLLFIILADLQRSYMHIVLVSMILASAFYCINETHETRLLVTKLDELSQSQDELLIEWRNLLIEEGTLDEHSRIRKIAVQKLNMVLPENKNDVLVELP